MAVAVILPARNESLALGQVLAGLPRSLIRQVIVVDNGSTDHTAGIARAAGATVVGEPVAGYGRACLRGLAALAPEIDTVVFMDADRSDYPEELARLIAPIVEGRADLVIGSRVARAEPGSLTIPQRFGNALACWLIRRLFGFRYTDLGPFRAIRRAALERLNMKDQAFGWTVEMQAKAVRQGLRIVEIPVGYRRRLGRSKISGTVKGTVLAGAAILSTIARLSWPRRAPGRRHLLIFVKHPTPGQVKTRLARELGEESAAEIYRACVELTLERLRVFRCEAAVYVDPPESVGRITSWLGTGWTLHPQQGGSLGERLAAAMRESFEAGAKRVVVIGTDSPWLQPAQIAAAFNALADHDLVLGPTEDGGYYLIGLSRPAPALFDGVAWSSPEVFGQTQQNARALGLRTASLPAGYDLDHLDDVERFVDEERRRGPLAKAVQVMSASSRRSVACQS